MQKPAHARMRATSFTKSHNRQLLLIQLTVQNHAPVALPLRSGHPEPWQNVWPCSPLPQSTCGFSRWKHSTVSEKIFATFSHEPDRPSHSLHSTFGLHVSVHGSAGFMQLSVDGS